MQQRQREECAMKFLFDDDTFSFETLRTAGFANYFGADLGEVLAPLPGSRHCQLEPT